MKKIPAWAWALAACGLGAIIAGSFFDNNYYQSVALQVGSTAFLLIPILLIERVIGRRLESQLDDYELIRRADSVLRLDEASRDFGQKLGGMHDAQPIDRIERLLTDLSWERYKTREGYTFWRRGEERFALPHPSDGLIRAPYVRALVRRTGLTDEQYAQRFPSD